MRIEDIDKNFQRKTLAGQELVFTPVTMQPFQLSGLPFINENKNFCRMPVSILDRFSQGIQELAWHTAGVQVRFRTTSKMLAVRCKLRAPSSMPHMPSTGQSGFDLYLGQGSSKCFRRTVTSQPGETEFSAVLLDIPWLINTQNLKESELALFRYLDCIPGTNFREMTINFPLYNGVDELEIGLQPDAEIDAPTPFAIQKPIVFYGSSITQGGCASHPGNAYTQHLSRRLDANVINLGFSGSAKGEPEVADVINSLDMSALVCDYDHNAISPEKLEETHEPFFKRIREKHPELPVVFVTRPDFDNDPLNGLKRINIVMKTYENALASGDKHVFFVDGRTLFGIKDRDACTMDSCHPNDLGFLRMADAIEPALRLALGI